MTISEVPIAKSNAVGTHSGKDPGHLVLKGRLCSARNPKPEFSGVINIKLGFHGVINPGMVLAGYFHGNNLWNLGFNHIFTS